MSNLHSTGALHRMVRYDAKSHILDCVGDMDALGPLFGNQILCAPYIPSGLMWNERVGFPNHTILTPSDLIALYDSESPPFLNQQLAKESMFQGKVMLVLKMGTQCELKDFKEGDWIWTLQENTRQVSISLPTSHKSKILEKVGIDIASGWICKIMNELDAYGLVYEPDAIV
jgi:hypothetical protein